METTEAHFCQYYYLLNINNGTKFPDSSMLWKFVDPQTSRPNIRRPTTYMWRKFVDLVFGSTKFRRIVWSTNFRSTKSRCTDTSAIFFHPNKQQPPNVATLTAKQPRAAALPFPVFPLNTWRFPLQQKTISLSTTCNNICNDFSRLVKVKKSADSTRKGNERSN
jgi:hypothetical protein